MAPKSDKAALLLVEGKDDQHVVWALCETHQVLKTFDVIVPPPEGGIEAVLKAILPRLKERGRTALGIVVDADENIQARWESLRNKLQEVGYAIPKQPPADGFVATLADQPRLGIWLMPDNQVPGMLEHFAAYLIPANDTLKPIAEETLRSIEEQGLNRYKTIHQPKALIHTWLAWQDPPGRPMGQAITNRVLQHNQPLASHFVAWLNRLFNPG